MRSIERPCELTPEERLQEIARMFAIGVLRLRAKRKATGLTVENPLEKAAGCLEVSEETVLSVHTG